MVVAVDAKHINTAVTIIPVSILILAVILLIILRTY